MSTSCPGFQAPDLISAQSSLRGREPTGTPMPAAGLVTACSYCDHVRIMVEGSEARWISREAYNQAPARAGIQVTHGICPECYEKIVLPVLAKLRTIPRSSWLLAPPAL